MKSISQARKILRLFEFNGATVVDRDQLVAFATLDAFVSHFPKLSTPEDSSLLLSAKIIFETETDRFYKQRRIALTRLARNLQLD